MSLLAYALIAGGNALVLSSMWVLGVTGTYLGDYFGILMSHRVTRFPFNITDAPMYDGSTMSFLGTALLYGKPAGVLLTAQVLAAYLITLRFEEYVRTSGPRERMLMTHSPFTNDIYAKRDRERRMGKKSS